MDKQTAAGWLMILFWIICVIFFGWKSLIFTIPGLFITIFLAGIVIGYFEYVR